MLGIINKALQSYVCDILGADDWYALCAATPLSADQYEPMLVYPDEETEVLIEAICLASGRTRDDMLEDFGNYVVSQHSSPAVRKLLRLGGETFVDFLYSLEQLHTRGAVLVPDLDLPNLRLEVAGDNQYILHCTEHKPGFGAVLQGILYAMASSYEALIVVQRGGAEDTEHFTINLVCENWSQHPSAHRTTPPVCRQKPDFNCEIPSRVMDNFMPMHLIIDEDGAIRAVGRSLAKVLDDDVIGRSFFDIFAFKRPHDLCSADDLPRVAGCQKIVLNTRTDPHYHLVGLISLLPDNSYLFNLSLGLGLSQALNDNVLNNNDFSPTDLAVDTMYFLEGQALLMQAKNALTLQLDGDVQTARRQAYYDPLTRLHNRRSVASTVKRLIKREPATVFAALLLDLDDFKRINDTMGHVMGDEVLKRVAKRLVDTVRHDDMVARLGGDEFFVLLRGFEDAMAVKIFAARIINRLSMPYQIESQVCQIGASLGAVMVSGAGLAGFDGVMAQIDNALYDAKNNGRGRACVAECLGAVMQIEGEVVASC